jgi:hypothetical protein
MQTASAQVANDDCASAYNLDSILVNSAFSNNCWNGIPADTAIADSTQGALVNFPYPTFPYTCIGYANSSGIPSNDVWYKVRFVEGCDLIMGISTTDTMHVVVWFGDSCNYLAPAACFTLLPGDTFCTVPGNGNSNTFFQISGNGPNNFASFSICLTTGPWCVQTYYTGSPTPFTCIDYDIDVIDATSAMAFDGTININIIDGNPPYMIQWDDGGAGFYRDNLSPGWYTFTITDSLECITTDSINVGVLNAITEQGLSFFKLNPNPATEYFTIEMNNLKFPGVLSIHEISGECIYSERIVANKTITFEKLEPGIYIISFKTVFGITHERLVVM